MDEADPFSCFGDDDEDDDSEVIPDGSRQPATEAKEFSFNRDPHCGVLAFHPGTEQALLKHVENELLVQCQCTTDTTITDRSKFVLDSIDKFCLNRHWMMHVGNEKAKIIEKFMEECCVSHESKNGSLVVVELGTYCGYSSIMLARTLSRIRSDFHIYSVEVVSEHATVAQQMIRFSGFENKVSSLLLDPDRDTLVGLLKSKLPSDRIDFLFIDHDKSLYLSDLQQLEESGLVKKDSFVAADNVVFAIIDDYRQYVSDLVSRGHVQSKLEECFLEYSEPDCNGTESKKHLLKDGIGACFVGIPSLTNQLASLLAAHIAYVIRTLFQN